MGLKLRRLIHWLHRHNLAIHDSIIFRPHPGRGMEFYDSYGWSYRGTYCPTCGRFQGFREVFKDGSTWGEVVKQREVDDEEIAAHRKAESPRG